MAKTQARIGDEGQRYEVRADWGEEKDMRVGWQDTPEGGLIPRLMKHPGITRIHVIDRRSASSEPIHTWRRPTTAERKKIRARRANKAKSRKRK